MMNARERPSAIVAHQLPGRGTTALWLGTAMLAGAVIMALELAAFRLYAPVFGNSIYVWGSLISVAMVALAVGYALGGWAADRSRTDVPLYGIILASTVYQLLVALTLRSILPGLAGAGEFGGPALATLILAPPMAALATAGPYVTRLLARAGHVGAAAGTVSALSTVGGVAGILGTSLFLVPRFGTRATLLTACAASSVLGVAGLAVRRRAALLALLPVMALPFVPETPWSEDTVWASESAYNLVRVLRRGDTVALVLNGPEGVQSVGYAATGWTGYYYDDFALGPLLVRPRRALVLGLGGGASLGAMRATAPDLEIEAVEIDPRAVEAAERFFGLRPGTDRLTVHLADARAWLARRQGIYDLVQVDVFQGGPYVPFHVLTVEFFRLVRARLSAGGVLMLNVLDVGPERALLHATVATLRLVFPVVAVLSHRHSTHLILAFPASRSLASLRAQLEHAGGPEQVQRLGRAAALALVEVVPPAETPVFTDDHSPVEEMTRRMLSAWRRGGAVRGQASFEEGTAGKMP